MKNKGFKELKRKKLIIDMVFCRRFCKGEIHLIELITKGAIFTTFVIKITFF